MGVIKFVSAGGFCALIRMRDGDGIFRRVTGGAGMTQW